MATVRFAGCWSNPCPLQKTVRPRKKRSASLSRNWTISWSRKPPRAQPPPLLLALLLRLRRRHRRQVPPLIRHQRAAAPQRQRRRPRRPSVPPQLLRHPPRTSTLGSKNFAAGSENITRNVAR